MVIHSNHSWVLHVIKRFFCILLLLAVGLPGLSVAHDSNLATLMIIHPAKEQWIFEVKTPLYGLDQSVRTYHEEQTGKPSELIAGSKEYKELLIDYIKAEFKITASRHAGGTADEDPLPVETSLGAGRIKLDNHETAMAFEINNMPEDVYKLDIQLPYMSENEGQNNIVRLIEADRSTRYILNVLNDFEAEDIGFFQAK